MKKFTSILRYNMYVCKYIIAIIVTNIFNLHWYLLTSILSSQKDYAKLARNLRVLSIRKYVITTNVVSFSLRINQVVHKKLLS